MAQKILCVLLGKTRHSVMDRITIPIDYDHDCDDEYTNYTGPIANLKGVPDVMKPSQIGGAALPMLVGSWKYVNETYSGIIKYGKVGDFHLTIPSRNGAQGPRI